MADQPEPEWELLPADPWGFFGIDRDAETIDLKRSYNRFIRRYKPEKHPQEFQRIRAAYEHVHNLIRYRDNRSGPTIQFDWASAFEASIQSDSTAKAESDSKISSPSPMPTIADRIESEPIPKLLAELTAKAAKSPRDYFQLAILDGILPQSDENFENWLLEGIGNYPREIGISGLFREYLENHLSTDRLSEVLHKSRKALPADRFFQLTEPAWDRLIRECSFDEFRTTLDHCEQKLSISSSYSTLIFYLRILKPAIWKADREWIDRVTAELEDHYFQLSAWGQQEFEVLCQISQYHQGATATNQNGLLRHMNEAMQHWCLDLDGDSDRTIVECQQHIASNGRLLLDEFPADEPMVEFLNAWNHIVEDVESRQGSVDFKPETVESHAFNFMARTTRRTSRGLAHAFGTWITLTGLGVALFALVVAIMFLVRMVLQLMNGQWLSALLDVVWSLLTIVGGAILGFIFVVFSGPTSKSQYAQIRGELLKLVRVIPMNPDELSVVLESMKDRKMEGGDEVMDARKIIDHLQDDPAMHIYASAHRLLRSERNG